MRCSSEKSASLSRGMRNSILLCPQPACAISRVKRSMPARSIQKYKNLRNSLCLSQRIIKCINIFIKVLHSLGRIGVNLSQIATAANSKGIVEAEFERCADFLDKMIVKYGKALDLPKAAVVENAHEPEQNGCSSESQRGPIRLTEQSKSCYPRVVT